MRSFGINAIQGYLFSKPLPAHKIRELIKEPILPARAQARGPLRIVAS
jgi:EAL domain-containing protein (putative c-di-GMP-specific phosphodiesterase class I)